MSRAQASWKIGIFTVMLPEFTPEQAAQEIEAAGYKGVEWRVTHTAPERRKERPSFWGNNLCTLAPTKAEAHRARSLADAHGLELPGLGSYIEMGDLATTEELLRFAQIAGASHLRVSSGKLAPSQSYAQVFDKARAFLKEVEPLARRYRVKALIEIHNQTISPSAGLARRLVDGFDPEAVGVIYDAGNLVYEGFEEYELGLELLGPYLAHVHLKNAAFSRPPEGGIWTPCPAPLEDGVVDFPKFFRALAGAGYEGWLVVEDFSAVRPYREMLRHNLAFIKQAMRQGLA